MGSPQDSCKCPPNPSSTCCSGPAPEMARCRGRPRPQGHPGCTASPCVPDGSAGPGGAERAESWGPGMASRCQGLIGASSPPFPKWRSTAAVQLGRSQADRVLGTGAHAARPSPPSPPDRSPRARQPSSAAWGLADGGVTVQSLCGVPGGEEADGTSQAGLQDRHPGHPALTQGLARAGWLPPDLRGPERLQCGLSREWDWRARPGVAPASLAALCPGGRAPLGRAPLALGSVTPARFSGGSGCGSPHWAELGGPRAHELPPPGHQMQVRPCLASSLPRAGLAGAGGACSRKRRAQLGTAVRRVGAPLPSSPEHQQQGH